jgi:hypothetical protein
MIFNAFVRRLAVAVTSMLVLGDITAANAAPSETGPRLRIVAATTSVNLTHWPGFPMWPDLGIYAVAGDTPLEVHVKRASYHDAPVATQVLGGPDGRQRTAPLPSDLVTDLAGFHHFTHLTVRDASGVVVIDRDQTFCPSGEARRFQPDAPDQSPYPDGCARNPFALGSVWGVQAGWATLLTNPLLNPSVSLADGRYTATITVDERYAEVFGIPVGDRVITVQLGVRTVLPDAGVPSGGPTLAGGVSVTPGTTSWTTADASGRTAAGTSDAKVPSVARPDLRALPAWNVWLHSVPGPTGNREYLAFNATVWTAGNSPLVVDGFRRPGTDIMDAYQYFYDTRGRQVASAPAGTMEWDPREGHMHWHFSDFARYQLLDADARLAVRSDKAAFCLAGNDPIDLTVPYANWHPTATDLHTACGAETSIAVRQVLDIGSGDTYTQDRRASRSTSPTCPMARTRSRSPRTRCSDYTSWT